MGEHHALRLTHRAAGEKDGGEVRLRRGLDDPLFLRVEGGNGLGCGRGQGERRMEGGASPRDFCELLFVTEEDQGVSRPHEVDDLRGAQLIVDGYHNGRGRQRGQVRDGPLGAVLSRDCHVASPAHTE